jgi:hypothetical protein
MSGELTIFGLIEGSRVAIGDVEEADWYVFSVILEDTEEMKFDIDCESQHNFTIRIRKYGYIPYEINIGAIDGDDCITPIYTEDQILSRKKKK